MNLDPRFEGIGTDKGKTLKIHRISNDKFNVVGLVSGNFRVSITARKQN